MQDWKDALNALRGSANFPEDSVSHGEMTAEETDNKDASEKKRPKLNMFYEKKGRAGKPATIITGFDQEDDKGTADIARMLKQRLGCGGSSRGGEILLQGDRREQASKLLKEMGF